MIESARFGSQVPTLSAALSRSSGHRGSALIQSFPLPPLPEAALVDYAAEVRRAFRSAAGPAPLHTCTLRVADQTIAISSPRVQLLEAMARAVAHRAIPDGAPDLTIYLWDGPPPGADAPVSPLAWYARHNPSYDLAALQRAAVAAHGEPEAFNTARWRTALQLGPNRLQFLDLFTGEGYYWISDARVLPYYEEGSPFLKLFASWFAARGGTVLHAGAVGGPAGGVLLVGEGGRGKSTTALACANAGFGYAGDDYCLVTTSPEQVHSLYNTAKLKGPDDLRRFPHLAPFVRNAERVGEEKALLFLANHDGVELLSQFPPRALLAPTVTGAPGARLRPLSLQQALRAVAPSTTRQLPGSADRALAAIAHLVRRLPAFALEVGPDLDAIPPLVRELLAELPAAPA